MKNLISYFNISALFFAAFFLSSCQEKIDIDLPNETESFLVVDGGITNIEGPQTVILSYTSQYFDSAPQPPATGANVVIADDQGNDFILTETDPGVYTFNGQGEIGTFYQLQIALNDGSLYQSNFELLYEVVPIDEIFWELSDREPNENDGEQPDDIYDVLINTQEPPGLGNYFQWRSFLNGVENQNPEDIFTASDEFVDGNTILNLNVTEDLYSQYDTVTIIQAQISQQASEFLTQLQSLTAFVGSPFDTPPAPLVGNITNVSDTEGIALGYFRTSAQSIATVVVGVE
jgi:hypothetical protein